MSKSWRSSSSSSLSYAKRAGPLTLVVGDDVVGPYPTGGADGKSLLGAFREFARCFVVAAGEGGLCRGKIGIGKVAFATVGHRQRRISVVVLGLGDERHMKELNRLLRQLGIVGGDQRLSEENLNERRSRRERYGAAQRRDRLFRVAALRERLTFKFVKVGIVGHRRDQAIDLRDGVTRVAVAISGDGPRVAGGQTIIGRRIMAQNFARTLGKTKELGAHHVVAKLQLRRIFVVPIRRRFRLLF